jgi:hypothetical protein
MYKNQDSDPGSGSGMNNPDHISESLQTIFWVKIFKFFDAGSGSGIRNLFDPGSGIRDKHPGSTTLLFLYFLFCFKIIIYFL